MVKILSALAVVCLIVIIRLAYLQLITDKYALNAANVSIKAQYDIPERGILFDRNGRILVGNQKSYEIQVTPVLLSKKFDSIGFCRLMGIPLGDYSAKMSEIRAFIKTKKTAKLLPYTFIKNLSREDVARIQEILFKYPAFSINQRPQRKYEIATSGSLLGYTNEVSKKEIAKDSTYYIEGDLIGKAGIEKSYEKELRGTKGIHYIQKDIKGRDLGPYKNGELDVDKISGKDLTLTVDYELQDMAARMLAGKRGAIVALDPKTGEILALASGPDIDPNLYTGEGKTKNITLLNQDRFNQPTLDRALQGEYPPGSTFKLLTALAGLQMGVMTDKTIFPCGGGFNYKGLRIAGHGGADPLIPAIQVSSNCYFSHAYLAILGKYPGNPSKGVDEWYKIMKSFGLGSYMNNDLAVGAKGKIPDGAFYEKVHKKKDWNPLERAVFNGMGQGDIMITPIQLANYTAAIANRGWYITPHIVKYIEGKPNPDKRFRVKHKTLVDPKYFEPVLQGMAKVVDNGTAASLKTKDFSQLAKTGTAQVPQGKDNSIFVLIAPAEDPKIVVVSIMEHAGLGATWAGPACTLIAEKYLTGEIKRTGLYTKMLNSSFFPEYKRQYLEKIQKSTSIQQKLVAADSLRKIQILDSLTQFIKPPLGSIQSQNPTSRP